MKQLLLTIKGETVARVRGDDLKQRTGGGTAPLQWLAFSSLDLRVGDDWLHADVETSIPEEDRAPHEIGMLHDEDRRTSSLVFDGPSGSKKSGEWEIIPVQPDEDGQIDLAACLAALGRHGLTRLFVEGGARLAAGLVREGLVDRILWFRAPILLGGDGIPALAPFGVEALSDAPRFTCLSVEASGEDLLETYEPRH